MREEIDIVSFIDDVKRGLVTAELIDKYRLTKSKLKYLCRKYKLKKAKTPLDKRNRKSKCYLHFDWPLIQKCYDDGDEIKDLGKKFRITKDHVKTAKEKGLFKTRTPKEIIEKRKKEGFRHSEQAKDKIRDAKNKWLGENPDKHPWKKSEKFKSQPCEWLKSKLREYNIFFVEEFQPLKTKGRYFSIDIAFPKKKFAIEINGNQHYQKNKQLKPYYQTRHDLIKAEGWDIWEVPYHETRSPLFLEKVLEKLKEKLVVVEGLTPPVKAINLAPL